MSRLLEHRRQWSPPLTLAPTRSGSSPRSTAQSHESARPSSCSRAPPHAMPQRVRGCLCPRVRWIHSLLAAVAARRPNAAGIRAEASSASRPPPLQSAARALAPKDSIDAPGTCRPNPRKAAARSRRHCAKRHTPSARAQLVRAAHLPRAPTQRAPPCRAPRAAPPPLPSMDPHSPRGEILQLEASSPRPPQTLHRAHRRASGCRPLLRRQENRRALSGCRDRGRGFSFRRGRHCARAERAAPHRLASPRALQKLRRRCGHYVFCPL